MEMHARRTRHTGPPIAVSVVMPCLNEERSIGICIRKAHKGLSALDVGGEIIVADNGSIDASVEIAERLNARVVREERKGYGAALIRGISAAKGDIILMGDADDSYDWSEITPFVDKILMGYDVVMGNRFRGGIMPGAMPPLHRYLGNPVLSCIGRIAFRSKIGDFHCGMRAFTKNAFTRMELTSSGMEFATEMVANATLLGLRVTEIPIKLYPDKRDRPPHLRSFRDGWRHLRFILAYAPDYLYVIPGVGLFLLGLLTQGLLIGGPVSFSGVSLGPNTLALGSLVTLVGFNILNLGVLAKALMARRYSRVRTRFVQWMHRRFTLEAGLILGLALALVGTSIDVITAIEWLRTFLGPMERTVNLSFSATTMIVLGVNLMFSSFLLHMILIGSSEPSSTALHHHGPREDEPPLKPPENDGPKDYLLE